MTASNVTIGILPGDQGQSDTGLGTDLRAGIGFDLGRGGTLGLEFRRLWLNGNFGPLSSGASMPIGGSMLLISLAARR